MRCQSRHNDLADNLASTASVADLRIQTHRPNVVIFFQKWALQLRRHLHRYGRKWPRKRRGAATTAQVNVTPTDAHGGDSRATHWIVGALVKTRIEEGLCRTVNSCKIRSAINESTDWTVMSVLSPQPVPGDGTAYDYRFLRQRRVALSKSLENPNEQCALYLRQIRHRDPAQS